MSLLDGRIRGIIEGCNKLDERVIPPKTEGRRIRGHTRRGAFELMGEDGASRRDGASHRFDKVAHALVHVGILIY